MLFRSLHNITPVPACAWQSDREVSPCLLWLYYTEKLHSVQDIKKKHPAIPARYFPFPLFPSALHLFRHFHLLCRLSVPFRNLRLFLPQFFQDRFPAMLLFAVIFIPINKAVVFFFPTLNAADIPPRFPYISANSQGAAFPCRRLLPHLPRRVQKPSQRAM